MYYNKSDTYPDSDCSKDPDSDCSKDPDSDPDPGQLDPVPQT